MSENGNPRGLNLDELAEEKKSEVITIGGKTFHPRIQTPALTREVRKIGRAQAQHFRRAADLEREGDEEKSDAEFQKGEACSYTLCRILLADDETKSPTVKFLEDHVHGPHLRLLVDYLLENEEDDEADPTPAAPTPQTASSTS